MRRTAICTAITLAAVALPSAASASFGPRVTNTWFPLKPGTVWRYRGMQDGHKTTDVVTATHRTKLIAGVRTRVVRDKLSFGGRVREDTRDYYAQDGRGTVWYFGEDTRELDRHGRTTTTEGTWRAGRRGARAGVIMPAHPRVGYSAAQENFPGQAEDHFKVLSLHDSVTVPFGNYRRDSLLTKEWTPLEPGVIDHKNYARGVGMVSEDTVKGPHEVGRLVSITRG